MPKDIETIGFYLTPGFTLAAVAAAVDVMALTNYVKREQLYRWCFLSHTTEPVTAMNDVRTLVDHDLESAPWLDSIVMCCGVGGAGYDPPPALSAWVRARYASGARIGAISTGAWCLARMNLLYGRRFTVHWEDIEALRETYPGLQPSKEIFAVDGRIFTCSGGTAAVDMFLSFVTDRHGARVARQVSEQLVHGVIRPQQEAQRLGLRERLGTTNQTLIDAVTLMESHCESPIPQREIATRLGVSVRQIERLFRRNLGATPQLYYRSLRLETARKLLQRTALPVREIALAVGFCTPSYFSKCYRRHFGRAPNNERKLTADVREHDTATAPVRD